MGFDDHNAERPRLFDLIDVPTDPPGDPVVLFSHSLHLCLLVRPTERSPVPTQFIALQIFDLEGDLDRFVRIGVRSVVTVLEDFGDERLQVLLGRELCVVVFSTQLSIPKIG